MRLRRWSLGVAAAWPGVVALSAPADLSGQRVIRIPSEPSCPSCSIELELVTTLGLGEVEDYVGMTTAIARTKAGFAFSGFVRATELVEVAQDGSLLRVVGRTGDGPGEYRRIHAIVSDTSDSLFVFDGRNSRMTVLSPTREVARTARLPSFTNQSAPVLLSDGHWIINTSISSPDLVGYPLHRLDAAGRVLKSFGADPGETGQDRVVGSGQVRTLLRDTGDSIWAAHLLNYRVDRFDGTGALVTTLVGKAPWEELSPAQKRTGWPEGGLIGIGRLADGRLLLLSRIADPGWGEAVVEVGRGGHRVEDYGRYYDSVIDVIDAANGRLVVRQVFDQFIVAFLEPATVAAVRTLPSSAEHVEICRISVKGIR